MGEVEGTPSKPTECIPFSKPSPFSSMTDGLGSQYTVTSPFNATYEKLKKLTAQAALHTKIIREMVEFQKTMDELHTLKKVSRDLRKYKKMLHLRKFD